MVDFVALLPPTRPLSLLDIGCGDCEEGEALIDAGISLTGVDQDGETIEKVAERLPEGTFITADAEHWNPAREDGFDAILMRRPDLFHRSRSWEGVFSHLPSLLADDGIVIVTTIGEGEATFATKMLEKSAEKVRVTESKDGKEGYVIMAEKLRSDQEARTGSPPLSAPSHGRTTACAWSATSARERARSQRKTTTKTTDKFFHE